MSLKAKLEAVIYAAEEPVTLAQLALLFTDEALEWKAEQEAEAAQAAEASGSEGESEPAADAELGFIEPELAAAAAPSTHNWGCWAAMCRRRGAGTAMERTTSCPRPIPIPRSTRPT